MGDNQPPPPTSPISKSLLSSSVTQRLVHPEKETPNKAATQNIDTQTNSGDDSHTPIPTVLPRSRNKTRENPHQKLPPSFRSLPEAFARIPPALGVPNRVHAESGRGGGGIRRGNHRGERGVKGRGTGAFVRLVVKEEGTSGKKGRQYFCLLTVSFAVPFLTLT